MGSLTLTESIMHDQESAASVLGVPAVWYFSYESVTSVPVHTTCKHLKYLPRYRDTKVIVQHKVRGTCQCRGHPHDGRIPMAD